MPSSYGASIVSSVPLFSLRSRDAPPTAAQHWYRCKDPHPAGQAGHERRCGKEKQASRQTRCAGRHATQTVNACIGHPGWAVLASVVPRITGAASTSADQLERTRLTTQASTRRVEQPRQLFWISKLRQHEGPATKTRNRCCVYPVQAFKRCHEPSSVSRQTPPSLQASGTLKT